MMKHLIFTIIVLCIFSCQQDSKQGRFKIQTESKKNKLQSNTDKELVDSMSSYIKDQIDNNFPQNLTRFIFGTGEIPPKKTYKENMKILEDYYERLGVKELRLDDLEIEEKIMTKEDLEKIHKINKELNKVYNKLYENQEPKKQQQARLDSLKEETLKLDMYIGAEAIPIFNDCKNTDCNDAAILNFVAKNFKYPEISKSYGNEGRVLLEFFVETDGKVGRVKIIEGVDKHIDQEAIRVIESLPKFKPAHKNFDPIPYRFLIPIKCALG